MTAATTPLDCDICGSADKKQITIENGYPISRCLSCGFLYVSSIPDVDGGKVVGEYYAGTKDEIDENRTRYERVSEFLLTEISRTGVGGTLLDVGCGYGAFLDKARAAGWEVYGTDLSEIAVEHARESLGLKNVVCSDLNSQLFSGRRFDAINLTNVLEHVPSPTATLRTCNDLLAESGVLTIRVPNMVLTGIKHRLKGILKPLGLMPGGDVNYLASPPPSHLGGFTATTLRRLLDKCGFDVIEIKPSKLSSLVDEKLIYRVYESTSDLIYRISLRKIDISHTILTIAKKKIAGRT